MKRPFSAFDNEETLQLGLDVFIMKSIGRIRFLTPAFFLLRGTLRLVLYSYGYLGAHPSCTRASCVEVW